LTFFSFQKLQPLYYLVQAISDVVVKKYVINVFGVNALAHFFKLDRCAKESLFFSVWKRHSFKKGMSKYMQKVL